MARGTNSLALLRSLERSSVSWHASRYTSAEKLYELLTMAHDRPLVPGVIRHWVRAIATDGRDADGAAYGSIPCLGGEARRVWEILLRRYC